MSKYIKPKAVEADKNSNAELSAYSTELEPYAGEPLADAEWLAEYHRKQREKESTTGTKTDTAIVRNSTGGKNGEFS